MDLWGLPLEEAEEPRLHSSSIAPSSVSASPPHSPVSKDEMKPNLTEMLHEMPHYQDVVFEPLRMTEPFPPTVQLPSGVNIESSYSLFSLFISQELIALLSSNTNKYAFARNAGQSGREWHETSASEIKIFLAILIYMGVHISPSDEDYWRTDEEPIHMPRRFMGLKRFQQIKRFFHVADPDPEAAVQEAMRLNLKPNQMWWYKLEPFAPRLRAACLQHWKPSNAVSIDETMIRGFGRSQHTFKMPHKPIKQGYKLFAIADQGYILYWIWASRHKSLAEVKKHENLTLTGSMVVQLAQEGLPPQRNSYTIYMDNYFTTVPLFNHLRRQGIGACGTTRPNASKKLFPIALHALKDSKKPQQWNTLYAAPASVGSDIDSVLCIAWQDNNIVTALSTVHTVHKPTDWITRLRKRPAKTSTSAKVAREPFGDQPTQELPIPRPIDDYNYHMGGVDRANQLRASYETHQRTLRSWWPIFFWTLDIAIINAYCMAKMARRQQGMKDITHLGFRKALYRELFKQGQKESRRATESKKRSRDLQNSDQPACEGGHLAIRIQFRKLCYWCKARGEKAKAQTQPIPRVFQTCYTCKACNVPLCRQDLRSCWDEFHRPRFPLGERDVNWM